MLMGNIRLHAVELLEVVLQLVTEELGHLDHPVALGRLGSGDDILLVDPDVYKRQDVVKDFR